MQVFDIFYMHIYPQTTRTHTRTHEHTNKDEHSQWIPHTYKHDDNIHDTRWIKKKERKKTQSSSYPHYHAVMFDFMCALERAVCNYFFFNSSGLSQFSPSFLFFFSFPSFDRFFLLLTRSLTNTLDNVRCPNRNSWNVRKWNDEERVPRTPEVLDVGVDLRQCVLLDRAFD